MSSAAQPSSERSTEAAADSPVDRALLAYLNDPTPARQAALLAAAQDSPEALADIQEFLAGDAELQQMMGTLGPLAANMLSSEATAAQVREASSSRIDSAPTAPIALAGDSEVLDPASDEAAVDGVTAAEDDRALVNAVSDAATPAPAQPPAPSPVSSARRWAWPIAGALVSLAALAAVAVWHYTPRSEEASVAGAMKALGHSAKPRRRFVPSADLWTPPVVAPGVWHYALGEQDPAAREGKPAADPLVDREAKQPLERHGQPTYGAPLAKGSRLSLALSAGEGYTGPVLTTATDNFCLEAWFVPKAAVNTVVVNNGNGATNGFGLLLHDNGHVGRVTYMGLFGGNRFLDTNINVVPGAPAHLAVVRSGGETTVYLNGKPFGQGGEFPNPADGIFQIGQSKLFEGQIDEVRVWVFAPGKFKPSDLLYPAVSVK